LETGNFLLSKIESIATTDEKHRCSTVKKKEKSGKNRENQDK